MNEPNALMKARLDNARQCLISAKTLLDSNDYKGSANRSYYAVFHAMRAMLAIDGFDSKKHSGIISEFRKRYIKTGVLDVGLSKIIDVLFGIRNESDYEDFFVIVKEDVIQQLKNASAFLNAVEAYFKSL